MISNRLKNRTDATDWREASVMNELHGRSVPLVMQDAPRGIRAIANGLGYTPDWTWSSERYKPMILALAGKYRLNRLLEIGGGRSPLFTADEVTAHGFAVTLNDIAEGELDRAPPGFATLCCDIAAADTFTVVGCERFDLAYFSMVIEHVPNVAQMWRNVLSVLAPGGVGLSFFPPLFAPPFAAKELMPERLSRAILYTLFPDRGDDSEKPKFSAHYDRCLGSDAALVPLLTEIGYREVVVLPFYGYRYFRKNPGLKQFDAAFTRLVRSRDWRTFTSFAYVIARKSS